MQSGSRRRKRLLRIIIPVILTVIVLSACDFSLFSNETPLPQDTQPPPPADTQPPPPVDTQPPPPVDTQPPPPVDTQPPPLVGLDYDLDPNFGEVTLEAGFPIDPYAVDIVSGGDVDVGALDLGDECYGYATSAPDLRLWWTGQSTHGTFRILFEAAGGEDTVLIVNNFYGQWECNDDFDFGILDPGLDIQDLGDQSLRMEIWVASYDQGVSAPGTLYITELDLDHDDVP